VDMMCLVTFHRMLWFLFKAVDEMRWSQWLK